MANTKYLLIGLPNTGKTTYLAALWQVVSTTEVPNALRLESMDGDTEYLNKIREEWIQCKKLSRALGKVKKCILRLYSPDDQSVTEIMIPDQLGEIFNHQFEERQWTKEFEELVQECEGIMLFVHPNQSFPVTPITDANELLGNTPVDDTNEGEPWSKATVHPQVKLVDIVQFILGEKTDGKALKICIIVSAWDLVKKNLSGITPEKWFEENLPLLSQFLLANSDDLVLRTYGLSAQGGDLESDAENLARKVRPSDRILVEYQMEQNHDITLPLKWLMGK